MLVMTLKLAWAHEDIIHVIDIKTMVLVTDIGDGYW